MNALDYWLQYARLLAENRVDWIGPTEAPSDELSPARDRLVALARILPDIQPSSPQYASAMWMFGHCCGEIEQFAGLGAVQRAIANAVQAGGRKGHETTHGTDEEKSSRWKEQYASYQHHRQQGAGVMAAMKLAAVDNAVSIASIRRARGRYEKSPKK